MHQPFRFAGSATSAKRREDGSTRTYTRTYSGGGFFGGYSSDHPATMIFDKLMMDERQLANPAHRRLRRGRQ